MGVETPCEPVPPHDVSRVYFEVVVAGGDKKKKLVRATAYLG